MKKSVLLLVTIFLAGLSVYAQAPQGFNYQAVARNSAGEIIKNQNMKVKVGILQGNDPGTLIWEEEHAVTVNSIGLFSLVIGSPDAIHTGGTVSAFADIDWSAGNYFLQVQLDLSDGNGYQDMGTTAFQSVPYALFAADVSNKDDADADSTNEIQDLALMNDTLVITKNDNATKISLVPYLDNPGWDKSGTDTLTYLGNLALGTKNPLGSKLTVQGDDITSEKPLFEVKRKDGQPVFVVYNDSIRMYVNANATGKGPRGGFAIGGFGAAKGKTQDYLKVTPDSVRIYIDQSQAKGPRGGFAIGGFGAAKGGTTDLLHLNKDNYFIGHQSGIKTTGLFNSFFGYQAGKENTSGSGNIFLGYQAGIHNTSGMNNAFIGYQSGSANTTGNYNVFLGHHSGLKNTEGVSNVFIGYAAGEQNIGEGAYLGDYNVFIGYLSGNRNTTGQSNVFIGNQSGASNTEGRYNTYVGRSTGGHNAKGIFNTYFGAQAGEQDTAGNYNTYIGMQAGNANKNGSNNVFIGYRAGFYELGSNKLYISNSWAKSPLIWGDFSNHYVVINGGETDHTNTSNFFVNGSAGGTGAWSSSSDRRLKKDIHTIPGALDKVMKLRGVTFEWKSPETREPGMRMGFVAQEARKVIPEVVDTTGKYMSMQYAPITALLVEAVKMQQKIIERQNKKIQSLEALQKEVLAMKKRLDALTGK